MPSSVKPPGVYIEEISSGARPIAGADTSNTAFVGYFRKGPKGTPVRVLSFAEFERVFGGLDRESPTSYAVEQYYLNGGREAFIVRVASGTPTKAAIDLARGSNTVLTLEAANEGSWGQELEVAIGHPSAGVFDLAVRRVVTVAGARRIAEAEIHEGLSMDPGGPLFVQGFLAAASTLVRAAAVTGTERPDETKAGVDPTEPAAIADFTTDSAFRALTGTSLMDGTRPTSSSVLIDGVRALDDIAPEVFNLLAMPDAGELSDDAKRKAAYVDAETFCIDRRAFLIADIPQDVDTPARMQEWLTNVGNDLGKNSAVYFPRLEIPDRLDGDRPKNVAASGTIAGIYARTDINRGVWKAPAGLEASLRGATLDVRLDDRATGELNPLGVNVLRSFPAIGNVVWGARTLDGADLRGSEWKYIPVRRTTLFIEQSLHQGLEWVVFEPNDEPLWAQIRLATGAFMNNLFRQGAFPAATPREAYFVKCDRETMTQSDIDEGILNILVGFAPLKPAEFVILRMQMKVGQV